MSHISMLFLKCSIRFVDTMIIWENRQIFHRGE